MGDPFRNGLALAEKGDIDSTVRRDATYRPVGVYGAELIAFYIINANDRRRRYLGRI